MDWITVISLVVIGIVLIIVEIIFIPGTTIVGILGFLITAIGVVLSFVYFGKTAGWLVLGGSGLVSGSMLYWSLRTNIWSRFALKSTISSKVNEEVKGHVAVGDEGHTTSSLRPMGKAEFRGQQFEVTTLGNQVPPGSRVKVVSISNHHIIVESISSN